MNKLLDIYHLFLESPYLRACLVFDKGYCQGLLLKKDLEYLIQDKESFFIDKIVTYNSHTIEQLIFNEQPKLRMRIPYINFKGDILGALLYDEFVSEFFPEDFQNKLSLHEIFDHFSYPLLILNHFKTILYLNNKARELLSDKALGKKISEVLLAFQISYEQNKMIICRHDEEWILLISESHTKFSSYYIYQFLQKNTP